MAFGEIGQTLSLWWTCRQENGARMCSERERESDSRGSVSSVESRRLPCRVTVMWYGRVKTMLGGGISLCFEQASKTKSALAARHREDSGRLLSLGGFGFRAFCQVSRLKAPGCGSFCLSHKRRIMSSCRNARAAHQYVGLNTSPGFLRSRVYQLKPVNTLNNGGFKTL